MQPKDVIDHKQISFRHQFQSILVEKAEKLRSAHDATVVQQMMQSDYTSSESDSDGRTISSNNPSNSSAGVTRSSVSSSSLSGSSGGFDSTKGIRGNNLKREHMKSGNNQPAIGVIPGQWPSSEPLYDDDTASTTEECSDDFLDVDGESG